MKRRLFLGLFTTLLLAPAGSSSPPTQNFSGTWKQSNERSVAARTGDVTLHIEHHDPDLTVETTIVRGSRHALQHYTTDGKVSVSTGADGDEFHTAVLWRGPALVFSIEEHEDGRIIRSRDTWMLIDNGTALERRRERDGGEKQTIIYLREVPNP